MFFVDNDESFGSWEVTCCKNHSFGIALVMALFCGWLNLVNGIITWILVIEKMVEVMSLNIVRSDHFLLLVCRSSSLQ